MTLTCLCHKKRAPPLNKVFNNSFTEHSSLCNAVTRPHNCLKNGAILKSPQLGLFSPKRTERSCLWRTNTAKMLTKNLYSQQWHKIVTSLKKSIFRNKLKVNKGRLWKSRTWTTQYILKLLTSTQKDLCQLKRETFNSKGPLWCINWNF